MKLKCERHRPSADPFLLPFPFVVPFGILFKLQDKLEVADEMQLSSSCSREVTLCLDKNAVINENVFRSNLNTNGLISRLVRLRMTISQLLVKFPAVSRTLKPKN